MLYKKTYFGHKPLSFTDELHRCISKKTAAVLPVKGTLFSFVYGKNVQHRKMLCSVYIYIYITVKT